MAAVSTTLLTVLRAGDHLLAQNCLYGGTHDFVTRDFPALGLAVDFVDGDREVVDAFVRPNVIYDAIETDWRRTQARAAVVPSDSVNSALRKIIGAVAARVR
jgi:hypothetical protein